jgi:hypothetical protein
MTTTTFHPTRTGWIGFVLLFAFAAVTAGMVGTIWSAVAMVGVGVVAAALIRLVQYVEEEDERIRAASRGDSP